MTIYFNSNDMQLYRKRRKGTSNRYGMSATLTVFPADVQPAQPERIEMLGERWGTVYQTFVDASIDVREGDMMVDTANGKKYSVKGIVSWNGAGLLDHLEITLVSQDGPDA